MSDDILDFDQEIATEFEAKPPVPFRFHGEIFKAHGDGPGMILLNFVQAAMNEDGLATIDEMLNFLKACMPASEYERFEAICNHPDIVTPIEHLGVVVRGLITRYTKPRPTQPSSPSAPGSTPTDSGSKDGSPAEATASTG